MRNGQNNKRMRNRNNNNNNNNNNSNRRGQNPMTRVFESNGPDIKIRGTASHVAEKYVQLARDARITTIYEGTTHIQALDLLGRKTLQLQGQGLQQFLQMIAAFCTEHAANPALVEFVLPLAEAAKLWGEITMEIGRKAVGNADEVGAAIEDHVGKILARKSMALAAD